MQYITTAYAAEQNAALVLRELGYTDAAVTPPGPDGGVDVAASKALAQVKWQGAAVGRPEVQQLFGSRGTDYAKTLFFFAASAYTDAAVQYANAASIALFTYDPLGDVTPINEHAVDQLRNSDSPDRAPLHSLPLPRANTLYAYLFQQGVADHEKYQLLETEEGTLVMIPPDPSLETYIFADVAEGTSPYSGLGLWVPMSEIEAPKVPWEQLVAPEIHVGDHKLMGTIPFFQLDIRAAVFAAGVDYMNEHFPERSFYILGLSNGSMRVSGTDLSFSP